MLRGRTIRPMTLLAVALLAPLAMAFPPAKPYDPRPLMLAAEKKFPGKKFTFVVLGDWKAGGGFPPLAQRVEKINPAFILLTGDMTAMATTKEYDRLDRQIAPYARKLPYWPCPGNHDVGGFHARQWPNYVKFWGIDARHYSFDFKNARFISLYAAVAQPDRGELKWLETQLAEGQKDGKLMFVWQHMPCYTVGYKNHKEVPNRPTAFTKLLSKYGVIANFSGHDHSYYRTKRDGVTYMIQALAGSGIYPGTRIADAIKGDVFAVRGSSGKMRLRNADGDREVPMKWLLTVFHVDGKKVTGETMSADGEVIDTFTLTPAGN